MLSYISHGKGDLSGYFLKFSQSFHLQPFITSVIAVENKNLERIAKRGIKIKRYAARKKPIHKRFSVDGFFARLYLPVFQFSFVLRRALVSASEASRLV